MNIKTKERIITDTELAKSLVPDEQAAQLLGISLKTLHNKVSRAKEQYMDLYTISPVTGKRFWYRSKIIGL